MIVLSSQLDSINKYMKSTKINKISRGGKYKTDMKNSPQSPQWTSSAIKLKELTNT